MACEGLRAAIKIKADDGVDRVAVGSRQGDGNSRGGLRDGGSAAGKHGVARDLAAEREWWQGERFTGPFEDVEIDRISLGHAATPIGGDEGTGERAIQGGAVL